MTFFSRGARVALLLALSAAAPAFAQTPPAPAPAPAAKPPGDPVVAVVNGQSIRLSDVQAAQANLPQQYRGLPLERIYPALLEQIIDAKLQVTEARKSKVQDSDAYKKRLAALEERLLQEQYLTQEIDKRVTPQALKERYEKKVRDLPPEEEVKARHILVADEAAAKAVIADLQKGGDFDKIAKDKSTDKASGAQGGDLGWFKKADMVKEFAEAAFMLKKGEVTPAPVKSQFGFHVIRLDDRRAAQPPSMEDMEDELRAELSREVYGQMMEGLRKSAKIEKFNMDGSKIPETPPGAPPATPPTPGKN
ncbi:peptidylprolyl isomerase [Reyranella sp. CPCC 100927]|uniref:peptidylprolyl isomerase n=1 Tax=Reyranella sp. CPCC 100927 TaxID=2599616 RepID=UPI0015B73162|nr:peptidylprolyl isomerase [Reyranella sp. CPCC 100927]